MGYNASGHGDVYIENRFFSKIEDKLDLEETFLEYLANIGFRYELNDEKDLCALVFDYDSLCDQDSVLDQIASYVRPGSWFHWKDEEDCSWINDFGHPDLLTKAYLGDEKIAENDGEWLGVSLDSTVSLEVKMCQPVKKGNVPGEPKVSLRLKRQNGEEFTWTGTARKLFCMLRSN